MKLKCLFILLHFTFQNDSNKPLFSELPHFNSKPSPTITLKETQNVLIPCKANGFPQPVITWYKNGHPIEKEKNYFGERSLKLKKIQFQDRGVYTCIAENLMGRAELSVNVSVKGLFKRFIISCCFYNAIVGIQMHIPSLKNALSCCGASLTFTAPQSVTRALQHNYLNLSFIVQPRRA